MLAPASCQKSLGIKADHVGFPVVGARMSHNHLQLQKCCRASPWHLIWSHDEEIDPQFVDLKFISTKSNIYIYIYKFHHSHFRINIRTSFNTSAVHDMKSSISTFEITTKDRLKGPQPNFVVVRPGPQAQGLEPTIWCHQ